MNLFLPIVERELRVRGRSKATYRFRVLAALLASLFVGALLLVAGAARSAGSVGKWMFTMLAWATFIYCLMQGVRNTADCLSEEKRAGTLGLLFLTDLRGHDVVLGKLMATSVNSFYMLLAVFPPLGIPLVLGGVTVGEFWRLVLALIVTLLFSLTAGLLVSSLVRDERNAWAGTVLLTGFFVVLVPLLQGLVPVPASPTCAFLGLNDADYSAQPGVYWGGVWWSLLLSAGFLVAASFILPRAWQEGTGVPRRNWIFATSQTATTESRKARQRLLDVNPVVWLAARSERQSFLVWTVILFGCAAAIALWFATNGAKAAEFVIIGMFILLHLMLAMWVASEACAVFPAARDTGALELLLSTPLNLRTIIDGHVLGLTRLFQRPLLVLLAVEATLLSVYLVARVGGGMPVQTVVFTLIATGMFVAVGIMDCFAVARYGLWAGLASRKPGWAVTKTILLVLMAPMLLMVPCILMAPLWPVIGIVKNLLFISHAQEQLRRHFRTTLTERYGALAGAETPTRQIRRRLESDLPPVLPR